MRLTALALMGAVGIVFSAASANAAPIAPAAVHDQVSSITDVAGGCGRGMHPTRWGRCVPNRYGYGYRHRYYGPRYGHRSWSSPGDYAAGALNRYELGRVYRGY